MVAPSVHGTNGSLIELWLDLSWVWKKPFPMLSAPAVALHIFPFPFHLPRAAVCGVDKIQGRGHHGLLSRRRRRENSVWMSPWSRSSEVPLCS